MLWSKPDRDIIYENTFHSQMDSEDVEKDRIKLENVKPPGMKMPVKEEPKPEQPHAPFTINITVNDDAVNIDSSNPDIKKSVARPKPSPVPVEEPKAIKPAKKADGIDFDFEPTVPKAVSSSKPTTTVPKQVVKPAIGGPVVREEIPSAPTTEVVNPPVQVVNATSPVVESVNVPAPVVETVNTTEPSVEVVNTPAPKVVSSPIVKQVVSSPEAEQVVSSPKVVK